MSVTDLASLLAHFVLRLPMRNRSPSIQEPVLAPALPHFNNRSHSATSSA